MPFFNLQMLSKWKFIYLNHLQFRQAKDEVVTASKVAYRFLVGIASNNNSATTSAAAEAQNGDANRGSTSSRFQGVWFKNLMSTGAKPSNGSSDSSDSSSSEIPSENGKDILQSDNHHA